jgi:hypothetical protein
MLGRIIKAAAVPVGHSGMWTLAFGHHEDRTPAHGYEATRKAAMAGECALDAQDPVTSRYLATARSITRLVYH